MDRLGVIFAYMRVVVIIVVGIGLTFGGRPVPGAIALVAGLGFLVMHVVVSREMKRRSNS